MNIFEGSCCKTVSQWEKVPQHKNDHGWEGVLNVSCVSGRKNLSSYSSSVPRMSFSLFFNSVEKNFRGIFCTHHTPKPSSDPLRGDLCRKWFLPWQDHPPNYHEKSYPYWSRYSQQVVVQLIGHHSENRSWCKTMLRNKLWTNVKPSSDQKQETCMTLTMTFSHCEEWRQL